MEREKGEYHLFKVSYYFFRHLPLFVVFTFFSLRYPLLCMKWSHLKVWISTFLAFLVVSMFLLPHKGKFFSVRAPSVRLPQKHQRKRNHYSCKAEDVSDAKSAMSLSQDGDNSLHFSQICKQACSKPGHLWPLALNFTVAQRLWQVEVLH